MKQVVVVVLGIPLLSSCSDGACSLDMRAAVSVVVHGANVDGSCAAEVVVVEGDYTSTLMCFSDSSDSSDCICSGAYEAPGTYEVTATFGDLVETKTVTSRPGKCHPEVARAEFF